jgi:signal transduction histidine kinase
MNVNDGMAVRIAGRITDGQKLALDVLLGVALAATSVPAAQRDLHVSGPHGNGFGVLGYLAVAVAAASVPARRRHRRAAVWVSVVAEAVLIGLGMRLPVLLAAGFAMYCLAAGSDSALSNWALAGSLAPMVIAGLVAWGGHLLETLTLAVLIASGSILIGWLAGENARSRHHYALALAERAAERERERVGRTLIEERARIARELHDVVAHTMSVIAVRSGVARRISQNQPEQAIESLGIIESISRSSLAELRRLVTVLRQTEDPNAGEFAPAPGLADLPQLVSQVAAAGISVDVKVEGQAYPLPPTEDLSAYRIAQEALTNVVRHSGADSATLFVRYRNGSVEIECTNPPGSRSRPAERSGTDGGHGIVGMRERVALYGGDFSAGPTDQGFRVLARLPVAEVTR